MEQAKLNLEAKKSEPKKEEGKDMNTMVYSEGYGRGCAQGIHEFNKLTAKFGIAPNGMTIMVMTCMICGNEVAVEAPLNINDIIAKHSGDVDANDSNAPTYVPPSPVNQPIQPSMPAQPAFDADAFWKKLRGR